MRLKPAAELLGVSTRTLLRWDLGGEFPAKREPVSGIRFYDEADVINHSLWFKLRREHKAHLRKLGAIRDEVNKFISTQPLEIGKTPKFHKYEEMKKAYDALREWERQEKKITQKYSKLPPGFKAKLDPEA